MTRGIFDVTEAQYGAVGDGKSRLVQDRFSDLHEARAWYGGDVRLEDEQDGAAIQKALDAARVQGGTVLIPSGVYICNQTLHLEGGAAVTLSGVGAGNAGGLAGSVICFRQGGNAPCIDARSSYHCIFEKLMIAYANYTYRGSVIDFSHFTASDTQRPVIRECTVGGQAMTIHREDGSVVQAVKTSSRASRVPGQPETQEAFSPAAAFSLVRLGQAIFSTIEGNLFAFAQRGITYRDGSGEGARYSNAHLARANVFWYVREALLDFGENVNVISNWFEPGLDAAHPRDFPEHRSSMERAYASDADSKRWPNNAVWLGNWFGDASEATDTWIDLGQESGPRGWFLAGNMFAGGSAAFRSTTVGQGLTMLSNSINTRDAGIDLGPGTWSGALVAENMYNGPALLRSRDRHEGLTVLGNVERNDHPSDTLSVHGQFLSFRNGNKPPTWEWLRRSPDQPPGPLNPVSAGAGATLVELYGNDASGSITFITGDNATAGPLLRVDFAFSYPANGGHVYVQLTPTNEHASRNRPGFYVDPFSSVNVNPGSAPTAGASRSGFSLMASDDPEPRTRYSFYYQAIQT